MHFKKKWLAAICLFSIILVYRAGQHLSIFTPENQPAHVHQSYSSFSVGNESSQHVNQFVVRNHTPVFKAQHQHQEPQNYTCQYKASTNLKHGAGKYTCETKINCSKYCNPPFNINFDNVTLDTVAREHPDVTAGGQWRPVGCPSKPMAIIIPYRDRAQHLSILLRNLIKFLKLQKKAFSIYVIEQAGDTLFNRASLLNIGFLHARKRRNYSCFIFHDVDMVPVRLCNWYECPESGVRHLAVSINSNPPKIHYEGFLGGVMALTTWAVKRINGFTNIMYGWGGEDDDTNARLINANITIQRYHPDVANYSMIRHKRDKTNPQAFRGLDLCRQTSLNYNLDGLHNVEYSLLSYVTYPLFTKITVELEGPKTIDEAFSYFDEKRIIYGNQLNITDIL